MEAISLPELRFRLKQHALARLETQASECPTLLASTALRHSIPHNDRFDATHTVAISFSLLPPAFVYAYFSRTIEVLQIYTAQSLATSCRADL
jgi:hypothetical protein